MDNGILIWDWNGTLLDDVDAGVNALNRMLAARGAPVLALKRVAEGPLPLDPALEPGQWRPLRSDEIGLLRAGFG